MKRYTDQLETKNVNAGEVLFNEKLKDNLLLFVSSGHLSISNNEKLNIEIKEGHFILLAASSCFAVKATTNSRLLLIHTGLLSTMIVNDPDWNPENPQVLPIMPALEKTLSQIEYYNRENWQQLN